MGHKHSERRAVNKSVQPSPSFRLLRASSELANRNGIYLGRRSTRPHVALYRLTRGRLGGHVPGWPEARILLLYHRGAKTGLGRRSPLVYLSAGEQLAVAASKGGQPTHPAWYHNLKAHPDATVQVGGVIRQVRARTAAAAERAELWPQFVAAFPSYDFYARSAAGRTIPIVILEPR